MLQLLSPPLLIIMEWYKINPLHFLASSSLQFMSITLKPLTKSKGENAQKNHMTESSKAITELEGKKRRECYFKKQIYPWIWSAQDLHCIIMQNCKSQIHTGVTHTGVMWKLVITISLYFCQWLIKSLPKPWDSPPGVFVFCCCVYAHVCTHAGVWVDLWSRGSGFLSQSLLWINEV